MAASVSNRGVRWGLAASALAVLAAPAQAALPCDADLDGDGDIGFADLVALLSQWGADPGGPPDFDGDGVVGFADLTGLLASWGPAVFQYGPPLDDPEAEQIGLEMLGPTGPLLIPAEIYERIDRDLDRIRIAEPDLVGEVHSPAWVPNELLVSLVPNAPQDEYPCLNEFYQVTNAELIFDNLYLLTFAGNLNVAALSGIYSQAPEVDYAEPNGFIGGQNFWEPTPMDGGVWRWNIDDGFHDCFDGCDCHRLYEFETDIPGNVTLISYQEVGAPWCDFGP